MEGRVALVVSRVVGDESFAEQDFQEDVVEVEFQRSPQHGLGFSITGGIDDEIEVTSALSLCCLSFFISGLILDSVFSSLFFLYPSSFIPFFPLLLTCAGW